MEVNEEECLDVYHFDPFTAESYGFSEVLHLLRGWIEAVDNELLACKDKNLAVIAQFLTYTCVYSLQVISIFPVSQSFIKMGGDE